MFLFCIWLTGLFLLAVRPALAYLDPGSGSYVFQLLIAGLLTASVTVKMYWRQIKSYIEKKVMRKRDED
ncbi:TPA: hypothetical protein DIV55_04900 [Patescibacteria group bacterium]|nr:hypothetical protein [Patescibacteria group bacterium]